MSQVFCNLDNAHANGSLGIRTADTYRCPASNQYPEWLRAGVYGHTYSSENGGVAGDGHFGYGVFGTSFIGPLSVLGNHLHVRV
jgi:hypothetical protein